MRTTLFALTLFILSGVAGNSVQAESLRISSPERQGMSSERLERVTALTQRYVDEGKLAGVITMINRGGKIVHTSVVGNRGADDKRPLELDHLFRIYSMTKPITAVAAMQLYEQGHFFLADPVSKYVPELKDVQVMNEDGELFAPTRPMTMRDLLSHTAGLSYGFNPQDPVDKLYREAKIFEAKDLTEFAEIVGKLPLRYQPGERWHYSVAVDITGLVIERLSGMSFDAYLKKHIFTPLEMEDTFFSVPEDKKDRFLPNHYWDAKEKQLKTMATENALTRYDKVTLFSGGGGLVSTTSDYMKFAEMLRNGGRSGKHQIISPKTLKFMTKNHLPKGSISGSGEQPMNQALRGVGFGLGFGVLLDPVATQTLGSRGSFTWGGAAGTIFWVDPVEDIVVIGMIQLMGSPWPLRQELQIQTYQTLLETNEE